MRVLLLSPLYRGGGAERCARDLFHLLPQLGVGVTMGVAHRQNGCPAGVKSLRLPGEKYLKVVERLTGPADWRHLGSSGVLGRLSRRDCSLVHLHNLHGGWLSLRAAQRVAGRIPVVWTLHDEWALTGGTAYDLSRVFPDHNLDPRLPSGCAAFLPGEHDRAYRRVVERWLPIPAAFISPSHYLMNLLAAHPRLSGVPRFLIPYGLGMLDSPQIDLPRELARARFEIGPEERVILLVAAHFSSPFKGIPLAVDALRQLAPRPIRVLVVGNGSEAIARQVPQAVKAVGFVDDPAVLASAYRAADVTLIPSIADNFPYVALESMACGTPLAAFRVGGLVEMIGDNERGLMADCFNTELLADNLRRLVEDRALARMMGAAGAAWVRERCDPRAAAMANLGVYRRALGFGTEKQ